MEKDRSALAGNVDGYSGSEVLEFLVDEVGNWRERLLRPRDASGHQ
jgi:hypothetical protein